MSADSAECATAASSLTPRTACRMPLCFRLSCSTCNARRSRSARSSDARLTFSAHTRLSSASISESDGSSLLLLLSVDVANIAISPELTSGMHDSLLLSSARRMPSCVAPSTRKACNVRDAIASASHQPSSRPMRWPSDVAAATCLPISSREPASALAIACVSCSAVSRRLVNSA
eukprot:896524-Pleurochrysis_carterae.AAC.2